MYESMNTHLTRSTLHETPLDEPTWRWLLRRLALIPLLAIVNFATNLFIVFMMAEHRPPDVPPPPLIRMFWVGAMPAIAWVLLSLPVQFLTRRLARLPVAVAVLVHIVGAATFVVAQSSLVILLRQLFRIGRPGIPLLDQIERHIAAATAFDLLVYVALVAGTLAWDNWRLSIRRERTATQLATELTRAELSALRSKMQPHFLFNALHGISSVMTTDVPRARRMMVALSNLLRSSLSANGDRVPLEQELQFTRDYLELQHMRFEDRLVYDIDVDARSDVRVPSFILQPLVENAVIHGMADRAEPTRVRVAVRELGSHVEIDVSDDGPGFPQAMLDGTQPLGVGLGALRARLQSMPDGRGSMSLRNGPDGGAQVILRVATDEEESAHA